MYRFEWTPRWFLRLVALLLIVWVPGCMGGSDESPKPDQPPDLVQETTVEGKALVLEFVESYNTNKERAKNRLGELQEIMSGIQSRDTGDSAGTFDDIAETLSSLQENFEDKDAVAKLKELADSLPGDVEAYRKEQRMNAN